MIDTYYQILQKYKAGLKLNLEFYFDVAVFFTFIRRCAKKYMIRRKYKMNIAQYTLNKNVSNGKYFRSFFEKDKPDK